MNDAPTIPRAYFWCLAGMFFILQAGMVYLFGDRSQRGGGRRAAPVHFHLLPEPMTSDDLSKQFFAIDPTVFPIPGRHGFSERAWLGAPPPQFAAPAPMEPPAWLALDTARLGTNFPAIKRATSGLPFAASEAQSAELEPWPVSLASEKWRSQSLVQLPVQLAARQLNAPSTLPGRTNAQLLSNSVVQIAVDSAGQVIAARLLGRAGSMDADNQALSQARTLRFRPSPSPDAVWGNIVFVWQTIEPTNTRATPPPPPLP